MRGSRGCGRMRRRRRRRFGLLYIDLGRGEESARALEEFVAMTAQVEDARIAGMREDAAEKAAKVRAAVHRPGAGRGERAGAGGVCGDDGAGGGCADRGDAGGCGGEGGEGSGCCTSTWGGARRARGRWRSLWR